MGLRRNSLHGLRKSSRHPGRNWQLDADYLHKLGETELEWLSRFMDESYHSATWQPTIAIHDRDQLRDLWRAYKANERDVMTRTHAVGLLESDHATWMHDTTEENEARLAAATHGAEYMRPGAAEDCMLDAIDARAALARRNLSKASACPKPPPLQ